MASSVTDEAMFATAPPAGRSLFPAHADCAGLLRSALQRQSDVFPSKHRAQPRRRRGTPAPIPAMTMLAAVSAGQPAMTGKCADGTSHGARWSSVAGMPLRVTLDGWRSPIRAPSCRGRRNGTQTPVRPNVESAAWLYGEAIIGVAGSV